MASLRETLRFLGVSDANMEDGSLRCDVNVSVRRRGEAVFGERCEVKNLNSLRRSATRFATKPRDRRRRWDARANPGFAGRCARSTRDGRTTLLRAKENLWITGSRPSRRPARVLTREYVRAIEASVPELPERGEGAPGGPRSPHALLPPRRAVAHPATLAITRGRSRPRAGFPAKRAPRKRRAASSAP